MKDKFKKIICGSVLAISLPVLSACGEKPTLATPTLLNIDQSTHIISWQKVENAEYYIVEINGKTYQTTSETFPATDIVSKGGKFNVRVLAVDRDEQFLPSQYSDIVSIENLLALQKPVLSLSNNILSWTDVGANFYVLSINDVKFEITGTSLNLAELDDNLLSAIKFGQSNSFNVYAKATSNNLRSEVSNTINDYIAAKQQTPSNVNVQKQGDNIILRFDAVGTATNYTVKINNNEYITNQTELDITSYIANSFGENQICVKANKVEQTLNQQTTLLYMESMYSSPVIYEHKPAFVSQQVTSLNINNGVLTFDAITGASQYIVFVNDNEYQTNTNSYNLASLNLPAGIYDISVKATYGQYESLLSEKIEYKKQAHLNTPGISILEQDNIYLVISPVQNATKYQVQINQMILDTKTLQVDITNYLVGGVNSISVTAIGDENIYLNSTEATTTYTLLGVPQNVSCIDEILTFDAVLESDSYEIYVNNNYCLTTQNTTVDISAYMQQAGVYQIKVRAKVDNKFGLFANTSYTKSQKLDAVTNLNVSKSNDLYTLTFSHNALYVLGFEIYVNNNLVITTMSQTIDITGYISVGVNEIYVVALGDGQIYLNSNSSQVIEVTKATTLQQVQNLQVFAQTGDYYLSFDGVSGAESYNIVIQKQNSTVVFEQLINANELSNNTVLINISSAITASENYTIKVTAQSSVQGVESSNCVLTQNIKSYNVQEYQNKTYFYNGKTYTYCITDEQKLAQFIYYAVLYRLESEEVYINFDYANKQNAYTSTDSLLQSYLPCISKFGVDINQPDVLGQLFNISNLNQLEEIFTFIEQVHDQIYLYYNVTSNLTTQKSNCVYTINFEYIGDYEATKSNGTTSVSEPPETTNRTFKIDSKPTAPVETVAQLIMAVQNGRKPQFITTSKTEHLLVGGKTVAERTYLKAREVLDQICTDSMTDLQKVVAIYNWIVATNEYDYSTCDAATGAPFTSDNLKEMAFYASGMLLNNLSVCKGISQAFSLMCNIEGIKTVETFGITGIGIDWENVDFTISSTQIKMALLGYSQDAKAIATANLLLNMASIGAHSWNRVYLDAGEGEQWYIVDATWEFEYSDTGLVTHNYFLINDNQIADNRKEFYPYGQFYIETDVNNQPIDFSANGSYNYYTDTITLSYITSQTDLDNVVADMVNTNANGFEVILSQSLANDYLTVVSQALSNNLLSINNYNIAKNNNYIVVYKNQ